MKKICTHCLRIAPEGAQWCPNQQKRCPPGTLSILFEPKEKLGNFTIEKHLRILRLSTIYQASIDKKMVFLKVAHLGAEDRLKSEALLLSKLPVAQTPCSALPVLQAANTAGSSRRPYGKEGREGELKYYTVYEYVEGNFLGDLLTEDRFLPEAQIGEIAIGLTQGIFYLYEHTRHLLLNLNPDSIFIREDKHGVLRPLILDLGFASKRNEVQYEWYKQYSLPAYMAPEQIQQQPCTRQTDVYLVGVNLYELLAGKPAFTYKLRSDDEVRHNILTTAPQSLAQLRPGLKPGIVTLVEQAMQRNPANRHKDIRYLQRGLITLFGEVPSEQKPILQRLRDPRFIGTALAIVAIAVIVIFLLWLLLGG